MTVNDLTKELVGAAGHQKIEILLTLSIAQPDGSERSLFIKAKADGAAASQTRDVFYISCDTIYAAGMLAIDPRNNR